MVNKHNTTLDRFLTTVPVNQLDDAEQFVREIKFMCKEQLQHCPIALYKSIPTSKQPSQFFRTKNRHRTVNETGTILNQALQQSQAFERGLDLDVKCADDESCLVFLPDSFKVSFSEASVEEFAESASLVDTVALASIVYQHDVTQLTENVKHLIVTRVPFYYCIRLK